MLFLTLLVIQSLKTVMYFLENGGAFVFNQS